LKSENLLVLTNLKAFDGSSELENLPPPSGSVLLLVADVFGQRREDCLAAVLDGNVTMTFKNLKIFQNLKKLRFY
jgi:hypothetical protein